MEKGSHWYGKTINVARGLRVVNIKMLLAVFASHSMYYFNLHHLNISQVEERASILFDKDIFLPQEVE